MHKVSTRIAAVAATVLILGASASPAMAAKKTAPAPKPVTTCTVENGCMAPYPTQPGGTV